MRSPCCARGFLMSSPFTWGSLDVPFGRAGNVCAVLRRQNKRGAAPPPRCQPPSPPPSCQFGNLGGRLSTLVLRIVTFSLLPFPPGVRTNNRPSEWKPGKATCELQRKGQGEQRWSGFTGPASTCVCFCVFTDVLHVHPVADNRRAAVKYAVIAYRAQQLFLCLVMRRRCSGRTRASH